MVLDNNFSFHSLLPGTKEWLSRKQFFPTPARQNLGMVFDKTSFFHSRRQYTALPERVLAVSVGRSCGRPRGTAGTAAFSENGVHVFPKGRASRARGHKKRRPAVRRGAVSVAFGVLFG